MFIITRALICTIQLILSAIFTDWKILFIVVSCFVHLVLIVTCGGMCCVLHHWIWCS